jgi:cbb3-type cytochrome oxidase maturation protein
MEFVYIALPFALAIAVLALLAFIWAARSGQFDDLETPSRRLLLDDVPIKPSPTSPEAAEAKEQGGAQAEGASPNGAPGPRS